MSVCMDDFKVLHQQTPPLPTQQEATLYSSLNQFSNVLEEIHNSNVSDTPIHTAGTVHIINEVHCYQVTDTAHQTVKQSTTIQISAEFQQWLTDLVKASITFVFSHRLPAKLIKKIMLISQGLNRLSGDSSHKCLRFEATLQAQSVDTLRNTLPIWSVLLEMGADYCMHVESNSTLYVTGINSLVSMHIAKLQSANYVMSTAAHQSLHSLVRLYIQLMQHCTQAIKTVLYDDIQLSELGSTAYSNCGELLKSQKVPSDIQLLAGTAINLVILLDGDHHRYVTTFLTCSQQFDTSSFGYLCLYWGMLSCIREEMLCLLMRDGPYLFTFIFDAVFKLCNSVQYMYHTFQMLNIWYGKMEQYSKAWLAIKHNTESLFGLHSTFTTNTLSLVWTHLDSSIDGVNEAVMIIFSKLLKLHNLENQLKTDCVDEFHTYLFDQLNTMSWHIKGKHGLMAEIINYTNHRQVIAHCSCLFESLMECLSVNYLAPSTTVLYKALLKSIKNMQKDKKLQINEWSMLCEPWLIKGLCCDDSLLHLNTSSYWLPSTMKIFPNTFLKLKDTLMRKLQDSSNANCDPILFALMAVLKVGRSQQLMDKLPVDLLEQSLQHFSDDLRQNALTLICVTSKKSESLSDCELALLRSHLPHCMVSDSAPYRHQVQTCVNSLITRARDSGLMYCKALKKPDKKSVNTQTATDDLLKTINFVDWLVKLCINNLHPGANFQRLKTSLDWLYVILDALTYQPMRKQRKGHTPETVTFLHNFAHTHGLWNFYSSENMQCLLGCILDTTDIICDQAYTILVQFFPWPLPMSSDFDTCTRIIYSGLSLCTSSKAYEAQSAALLVGMIYKKYVVELKQSIDITGQDVSPLSSTDMTSFTDNRLVFLQQLIDIINHNLQLCETNILQVATSRPVYGYILTLRQCINSTQLHANNVDRGQWQIFITNTLETVPKILNISLDILGGRIHSTQSTAPSFEQIGIAIQSIIAENVDTNEDSHADLSKMKYNDEITSYGSDRTDDTSLSTNHQLLMTWAWTNIRECSMYLSALVTHLQPVSLLSVAQIESISRRLSGVLTCCRHRGAIEGCMKALQKLCTVLLHSTDGNISSIPSKLLNEALDTVTDTSRVSSITRRSAGLSLLIQAVIASEGSTKQSNLLCHAISRLFAVMSEPEPSIADLKLDLPQVHALNLLLVVFKESSVSQASHQYLAQATTIAIKGFSSVHWAVRNSSTQLFGILSARLLGQKKDKFDSVSTTTAQEFFANYPMLYSYMLKLLQETIPNSENSIPMETDPSGADIILLHPGVFPVLTLLAKLAPGIDSDTENHIKLDIYHRTVLSLRSSALYAVRALSSKAIVSLTAHNNTTDTIYLLINDLQHNQCSNFIHGTLMHLEAMIQATLKRGAGQPSIRHLVQSLYGNRAQFTTPRMQCSLITAKYLSILRLLNAQIANSEKCHAVYTAQQCVEFLTVPSQMIQIGNDYLHEQLLQIYLFDHSGDINDKLVMLQCNGMCSKDWILCMRSMILYSEGGNDFTEEQCTGSLDIICGSILVSDEYCQTSSLICEVLLFLIHAHNKYHTSVSLVKHSTLCDKLTQFCTTTTCTKISSLSVIAMGTILADVDNLRHMNSNTLQRWCSTIENHGKPANGEAACRSAARAISMAGSIIFAAAASNWHHDEAYVKSALSIWQGSVSLLGADYVDIRESVTTFIVQLQHRSAQTGHSLHPSRALQVLCNYLLDNFSSCETVKEMLFNELHSNQELEVLLHRVINKKNTDVFETEDLNPYGEKLHTWSTIAQCLLEHDIIPEYTNQLITEQLERMKLFYHHGKALLNVTYNKQVFEQISLMVLNVKLKKHKNDPSSDMLGLLNEIIVQAPLLHPYLIQQIRELITDRTL